MRISLLSFSSIFQAPPESRKVFCAELHSRVGEEGAKVLRELGQRVKTMTKLSSPNILSEVHLAAEVLQKKIDEKSYLLLNTESLTFSYSFRKLEKRYIRFMNIVTTTISDEQMTKIKIIDLQKLYNFVVAHF